MPITVLLADDKEVIRNSIRLLLDSDREIHTLERQSTFSRQCRVLPT
jgi:hypothetical protein